MKHVKYDAGTCDGMYGTVFYISPWQCKQMSAPDEKGEMSAESTVRDDVWAMGRVLLQLLAGAKQSVITHVEEDMGHKGEKHLAGLHPGCQLYQYSVSRANWDEGVSLVDDIDRKMFGFKAGSPLDKLLDNLLHPTTAILGTETALTLAEQWLASLQEST